MSGNLVIERRPSWRTDLLVYVNEIARRPHSYGEHDCALFPADALLAMTGVDIAEEFRGKYGSTRAGLKLLRKKGYRDHVEYLASFLKDVAVSKAYPGDVAVVMADDFPHLGIVQGPSIYMLRPSGLGTVPLLRAERALSVPWPR